jgi:UDP-2-acetamido-2-deoxy-ribo-hexuluronate aminotransferase
MKAITNVLERGDYINGKDIDELEERLARYSDTNYCIATSSGTDALLIALLTLDIGPNDEVITSPYTWISTSEVISLIGAKPVFVDIDEDTFNINPNLIEEKINDRTKAILGVSMFGQMADYETICQISMKYGIPVIDDSAQSFGSTLHGRMSPYYNSIVCTSFFPTKVLGGFGDGGAILTCDEALANKMRAIRNHGKVETKVSTEGEMVVSTEPLTKFNHQYIGTNSRMDTIKASLLKVKLERLPEYIVKRKEIARYYSRMLSTCRLIKCPKVKDGYDSVWAIYTIVLPSKKIRDYVFDKMKSAGVNLSIFYPKPLHLQPCFEYLGYAKNDFPISEKICDLVLSLPCYPELNDKEQNYIVNKLLHFVQTYAL